MQEINQKFVVKIKIEDNKQSTYESIKREILKQLIPTNRYDDNLNYSNYIQDRIIETAKKAALKHGIQAYIADYEEREGCFEIEFLLILETVIVFSHLRHLADIIKEDIESLFHTHNYYIRGHVHPITNNRINSREHLRREHLKRFFWTLFSISVCGLIAVIFFILKSSEHSTSQPNMLEIGIKFDTSQSLFKTTNNIIIYKDTLRSVQQKGLK
jgi:hypothetical protein